MAQHHESYQQLVWRLEDSFKNEIILYEGKRMPRWRAEEIQANKKDPEIEALEEGRHPDLGRQLEYNQNLEQHIELLRENGVELAANLMEARAPWNRQKQRGQRP